MVDKESENYRPRRAFVAPDSEPADEPAKTTPTPAEPKVESPKSADPAPKVEPTTPPVTAITPPVAGDPSFPTLGPLLDDDQPKPLYRDEVAAPGAPAAGAPADRTTVRPAVGDDATSVRPITFTQKRNRFFDDEETTVLPRSRATGRSSARVDRDVIDDSDDDEPRTGLNSKLRMGLLIGAVAAITVIGLAIAYAVIGVGKTPQTTAPTPSTATSAGSSPTSSDSPGSASPAAGQVLTTDLMLTPEQAKAVSGSRTWKIDRTDEGPTADAPVAACFGGDPVEGEPTPQQQMSQLLSSDGKSPLGILHQAWAYASQEEATQAFVVASKTLGTCPIAGSYIAAGRVISGIGDLSTGVQINTVSGNETQVHSVVLSRTGRVVNVVDAIRSGKALSLTRVAKATSSVVSQECTPAGGSCTGSPVVKEGPPPLGGDEPGYFAVGDLPPAGNQAALWAADSVGQPEADFLGSGCEVVHWDTLDAEAKTARTYLYTPSGDAFFGVNEIILTLASDSAATKQAKKISDYVDGCKKRKLTATITGPVKVSGAGAQNSEINGTVFTVTQKSTKGPQKYRVGIVSTGSKVIYTFSNPKGDFDFTDAQWQTIALRAGERATQVN